MSSLYLLHGKTMHLDRKLERRLQKEMLHYGKMLILERNSPKEYNNFGQIRISKEYS